MSRRPTIFGPRVARRFGRGWLSAGFAFLYLPIVALVLYSFNRSALSGNWGGLSLDWYRRLLVDEEIKAGLGLSLKVAFLSATCSVALGTLAAVALTRYVRFPGRTFFTGMLNAPLVMPEVILGLSLLLLTVASQRLLGHPERGVATLWLGHLTMGLAYAAVVVQARLQELDPKLEEAAMDLGARPLQVFLLVTLPLVAQSMASAWLLTFSLSLDDVVVTAFLNGPGATPLPIVIFSRARLGLDPSVNAVATLIIFAVAVAVALASIWVARSERRRAAEISAAQRDDG